MPSVQIWRYAAPMTFGEYLQQAMRVAGYPSAISLARATGLSESGISKWRTDAATPTIPILRQLAPLLGIPLLELVVAADHLTWQEARLDGPVMAPAQVDVDELLAKSSLSDFEREVLANRLHQLQTQHSSTARSKERKSDGENPDRRRA